MKIKQEFSKKTKNILFYFLFDAAVVMKGNKSVLLNSKKPLDINFPSLWIPCHKIADRGAARLTFYCTHQTEFLSFQTSFSRRALTIHYAKRICKESLGIELKKALYCNELSYEIWAESWEFVVFI